MAAAPKSARPSRQPALSDGEAPPPKPRRGSGRRRRIAIFAAGAIAALSCAALGLWLRRPAALFAGIVAAIGSAMPLLVRELRGEASAGSGPAGKLGDADGESRQEHLALLEQIEGLR